MIKGVFLCDTKWKIKKIYQCEAELLIREGELLTDLVLETAKLKSGIEEHYSLELTFTEQKLVIPAVIDGFREGSLVVLAQIRNNREFMELNNEYSKYLEWAKNHLIGLYHNEYFQIQQMNNQLVDAQRRLTRSNRQLEHALKENREINEKLEKARIFAERANDSKTRFLANMSHDIRTPMNAITGLTELMRHHLGDEEVLKGYLAKLQFSSHYLLELINDILDLSKIENGSMELRPEPMNIGRQIEQVITILRPKIDDKKQKLSVQSNCGKSGYLKGDPVRFRQVLMNVLSNAVKYTPDGGNIRFIVRETGRTEYERKYQFTIEDSGIGMTPEFIEHIFDPFARAESEVKEIQGTGLGMTITKSIIDAMGGTIQVESTPGKGSCFCIELSFEVCDEREAQMAVNEEKENMENESPASLQGMRFLCAEDNELNGEILKSIMEMEGAECRIYKNGKLLVDAFEMVHPGQYDAILMDVQMPVMDGYEAAGKIRNGRNPFGRKIPIIAMTANAFAEDIRRCIDAGMDAYITKPIDITILKNTIHRFSSERKAGDFDK